MQSSTSSSSTEDVLDEKWSFLERGLDSLMQRPKSLDTKTYMALYSTVHDICHSVRSTPLTSSANRPALRSRAKLDSRVREDVSPAEKLYTRLGAYLSRHLEGVYRKSETHDANHLLSFYIEEWESYTAAAKEINHVFSYLNRTWVKRRNDEEEKPGVGTVYVLHLAKWRGHVFLKVQKRAMNTLLNLVQRHRDGREVDRSLIKNTIQSFVLLGLDENNRVVRALVVYTRYFEKPFIAATRAYYERMVDQLLSETSVVEYLKQAESWLEEEETLVALYLLPSTMGPLLSACEDVLVRSRLDHFSHEIQNLQYDRLGGLVRMYPLLARIKGELDPVRR